MFEKHLKSLRLLSLRQFSSTKCSCKNQRPLNRVVITGLGAVSPLGNNASTSWSQLKNGKSFIAKLESSQFDHLPCKIAGSIDPNLDLKGEFKGSDDKLMTRATKFALLATQEAIVDSKILDLKSELDLTRCGVSIGTSMMDVQELGETYKSYEKNYKSVSPFFCPKIILNMAAGLISIKYGFKGMNQTISTACASGTHAIGNSFNSIKWGTSDLVICGGTEASINPFTLAIFCRLRALSTKYNDKPNVASRPFDKDRDGFVMGEGAAILVLESLEHALRRKARIYAEVLGYGQSCDAFHVTAPSNDSSGAISAMGQALKDAEIPKEAVSYINAHGSSTPIGDAVEVKAIQNLFGEHARHLSVSSTKGSHGHLLGAAGSLELVFTVKGILDGILPPTVNCFEPDEGFSLDFIPESRKYEFRDRKIALKNSFGFGGTNCCICVGEYS